MAGRLPAVQKNTLAGAEFLEPLPRLKQERRYPFLDNEPSWVPLTRIQTGVEQSSGRLLVSRLTSHGLHP